MGSMANKNYKRLGDYIQQVNVRNRDSKILNLQGLSMTKEFRKSTSNIIGTDLSKYKVVQNMQFCCDFMSVIRVKKFPVVLNTLGEDVIISPAYIVFEVANTNVLMPEYLMMWFRRSEFDRYADFRCDSSIRGGFQWDELCESKLPIPSIEKQREIVAEYQSIENKIKVNEQICEKLEEAAQALYRHWFVDFEFPNEEGLPYKSSGGEMVWNEEMEKEVPRGWEVKELSSLCSISSSKRIYQSEYVEFGVPFYRGKEITLKKQGYEIIEQYYISEERYKELTTIFGAINEGDILMTAVGTIGSTYMAGNEEFYFKDGNIIWLKDFVVLGLNYYIYDFMQSSVFNDLIEEITIGSTQNAVTIKSFGEQRIIIPGKEILNEYKIFSKAIQDEVSRIKNENLILFKLKHMYLSKIAMKNNDQ